MRAQPDPRELDAVAMDEDALCVAVLDLYARGGIDGVLDGPLELRSAAGCRALACLGQEIRHSDPDRSAACMAWAEILASRLRPGELGEHEMEDLRCEMALEVAWSWMDLKQTAAAEEALGRAILCLSKGTRGNHVLRGGLLDTWAVLLGSRHDFDKARQAARAALAHYEKAGDRHYQGRTLYRLSLIEECAGDAERTEKSLGLVSEALARLDAEKEPGLYLSAVHQQVICLVGLGRFREARVRLFESLGHLRKHGHEGHEILRATLSGQINAGIGRLDAAERDLLEALVGVWLAGLDYTFGLLALELCAVWLDQGRDDLARAGGLKVIEVFRGRPLPAGGRKAMLVLEMALEDDRADADLLRRTARYMHELLNDPNARFRLRA